jgi:hypothetical protein
MEGFEADTIGRHLGVCMLSCTAISADVDEFGVAEFRFPIWPFYPDGNDRRIQCCTVYGVDMVVRLGTANPAKHLEHSPPLGCVVGVATQSYLARTK